MRAYPLNAMRERRSRPVFSGTCAGWDLAEILLEATIRFVTEEHLRDLADSFGVAHVVGRNDLGDL